MEKKQKHSPIGTTRQVEKIQNEQQLLWIQQLRGRIPEDLYFFPVAYIVEIMAENIDTDKTQEILRRYDGLREKHGLSEGEDWDLSSRPDDVLALDEEFAKERNRVKADTFRKYGEEEYANLLETDPKKFDRLRHQAWKKYQGERAREILGEEFEEFVAFADALYLNDDELQ